MKALGRAVVAVMVAGVLRTLVVTGSTGCSSDACGCDDSANGTAHQSLECLCKGEPESCPKSAAEYEAELCQMVDGGVMAAAVVRRTGCGTVTIGPSADIGGLEATFDEQSGALVGVYRFGDIPWGECNVFSYAYGRTMNDCAKLETCVLCGVAVNTARCP